MWENICLANRNQILELIDTYVNALKETRNTIAESHPEEIKEFFSSAKEYRDSFNISHRGPIRPVYQLFCDLIDEAGGIATIATILASNNISIKNIGIIHNREFQQGVLQVEFYDSNAYDHAVDCYANITTPCMRNNFLFSKNRPASGRTIPTPMDRSSETGLFADCECLLYFLQYLCPF